MKTLPPAFVFNRVALLLGGLIASVAIAMAADAPAAPSAPATVPVASTPPPAATTPAAAGAAMGAAAGARGGRRGGAPRAPAAETASASEASPTPKAPLIVVEDFESTPVGKIPFGFTATSGVAVAEDFANSGKKSLKIAAAASGARRITLSGDKVTALGGQFWGRVYYRVQQPYPRPTGNGVIHSTIVAGSGISPLYSDKIEVRMLDTVMNAQGAHQYIYNVQPSGSRKEFGKGSQYLYHYTDAWTLAEWSVNSATQSYHLYINGEEIKGVALDKGAGNFAGEELPTVFTSLSFGWNNYQAAGTGFIMWLDDLALGKERIGPRATDAVPAATAATPAATPAAAAKP